MGQTISGSLNRLASEKEIRILTLGLDAAGKTTLLFQLKLGGIESTIPTVGFHVETTKYKNICFTSWDLGTADKIRHIWRTYFDNVPALIYVVDSNDLERLPEAKSELADILKEEKLKDCVLLVLANKQDLPYAIPISEITEKLGLNLLQGRRWHIQGTCISKEKGIKEGIDWLTKELTKK